jgi:hypothetical protein
MSDIPCLCLKQELLMKIKSKKIVEYGIIAKNVHEPGLITLQKIYCTFVRPLGIVYRAVITTLQEYFVVL